MVTLVLNPPVAFVTQVVGAITPAGAAVMVTPPRGKPNGNPTPVTKTIAPGTPPIGERVMAGVVTVKPAVAETTPTVTVIVVGPKGAACSIMIGLVGNAPTASLVKVAGAMIPGAVMTPAVPGGKPVPFTVMVMFRAAAV
jgi:hypothetical protein